MEINTKLISIILIGVCFLLVGCASNDLDYIEDLLIDELMEVKYDNGYMKGFIACSEDNFTELERITDKYSLS